MDQKLHHTSSVAQSPENPEQPILLLRQTLLEEQFAAEIDMVRKVKLQARPEAIENLLHLINRKTLEEQH